MEPDEGLLNPGWAGEVADDEMDFIKGRLLTDKRLARPWGFRPGAKLRPDRAIRAVAMDGDLDNVGGNGRLARVPREKAVTANAQEEIPDSKLEPRRAQHEELGRSQDSESRSQGKLRQLKLALA